MHSLFILTSLLFLSQGQISDRARATVATSMQSSATFTLAEGGQDWGGLCATGRSQTPIDVLTAETLPISDPYFSAISFDAPPQVMPMLNLQNIDVSCEWNSVGSIQ